MSRPEDLGIVLRDEIDDRLAELRMAAMDRILDSKAPINMGQDDMDTLQEVDFILEDERISRFVAARVDSHGFQAAMLAFDSKDFPGSVPPIPEVVRQSELALAGKLGSLTCVDFFTVHMVPSPIRLVGVETLAGTDRIKDLTRTLQHPDLKELTGRVQVARYAPAAVVLVEAAAHARNWAERYFVSRKLPEVVELAPAGSDMRGQLEAAAASLNARMLGNQEIV